jgi:hypothetical protein
MVAAWLNDAHAYPMAPAGGLFLVVVGVALCLGAPLPRWRQAASFIGIAVATIAMTLSIARISAGLPAPTTFAIGALVFAVALEVALFPLVIRRLWPKGQSAVMQGSLALVGAHFLLMAPAFGPPIFVLGLLCMLNAAVAMMSRAIPDSLAWGSDGLLKMALGAVMLHGSPMFS